MKEKYLHWIDLAKGIGIILVLVGHSNFLPITLKNYIYSFHMPLFFILSGYVFSNKSTFKTFLTKKIKTLLFPYLFFFIIFLLFFTCKDLYLETNNFYNNCIGLFFQFPGYVYSIWFLICLFVLQILFYFVTKRTQNNIYKISFFSLFILIIGIIYFKTINVHLIWQLQILFTALPFFSLGYIFKITNILNKIHNTSCFIICFTLSLFLFYLKTKYFISYTSLTSNIYGNFIIFYLLAISSSLYIVIFSKKISYLWPLNYIGKNSLVIFSLQQPLVLFPLIYIFEKYFGNHIYMKFNLIEKLSLTTIELYITLFILILINLVLKKSLFFIFSEKK